MKARELVNSKWYFDMIDDEYEKLIVRLKNCRLYGINIDTFNIKEIAVASYLLGKAEEYAKKYDYDI